MFLELENKTVVITGAASCIGKACAQIFAREGSRLFLLDINKEGVEAVANEIRTDDRDVFTMTVDISVESEVQKAFEAIQKKAGCLDVLINSAGVINFDK